MPRRRLALGWILASIVLSTIAVALLLAGLINRSTSYPNGVHPKRPDASSLTKLTDPARAPVPLAERTAVLTFDGGPSPRVAGRILALLRHRSVPATFFVTGSDAVRHPATLRAIVAGGDELGNGGFTYSDLANSHSWRQNLEMNATQSAIVDATGTATTLARPFGPGVQSAGDGLRVGRGALAGYDVVPTGQSPTRWDRPGPAALAELARPNGRQGVIVSLPATDAQADQTLQALPAIIDQLQARGYRFTTVSDAYQRPTSAAMHPVSAGESIRAWITVHAVRISAAFVVILGWLLLPLGALAVLRTVVVTALALAQVRKEKRRPSAVGDFQGPVSILVPAYNEEANIAATLTSLLSSRYPDFEVIVVDDGSTDRTPDVLATFADRATVLRQPNSGKAAALNTGIRHARHDVLVMVDGDTVFEPDTLAALVAPMWRHDVGAVAGNTKVANRRGLLGRWQHLEYVIGMNLDRRMFQLLDCMPTVPGAVGAFRRAALADAGGGVPTRTLAEDTDLTMAVNLAGWEVVYAARAIAWTEAPSTVSALARQRFRWSYGTMQAMWAHRRSIRPVRGHGRGHVGSRGIPYLVMFQVAQPLFAPIIDLYLIYALLFLDLRTVVLVWLVMTVLQLLSAWIALRLDRESARPLWALPVTQIFYRQLLYIVVLQSVASALSGARLRWHQPPRAGAAAAQLQQR